MEPQAVGERDLLQRTWVRQMTTPGTAAMAKWRKGSKTNTKDETPCVKCDSCGRWVYRDETPFLDLAEAKEVDFKCTLCHTIEDLEEQLTSHHRHACETQRARIETLQKTLQAISKQLHHLQQHLSQPLHSPSDAEGSPHTYQLVQAPDEL